MNDTFLNTFSRNTGRISDNPYITGSLSSIMNTIMMTSLPLGNILYVNKGGLDTNTGAIDSPFLTVNAAMASIVDATPDRKYQIIVGPGRYMENVSIKANVFITGTAPIGTIIDGIDTLDPTWTVDTDNRSGIRDIEVYNDTLLDFITTGSNQGKFYTIQCRIGGNFTFSAFNSVNESFLYNCELLGNLNQQGGSQSLYSITIYGNVDIVSSGSVNRVDTLLYASGGGNVLPLDGSANVPTFSITHLVGSPAPEIILVNLAGFAVTGNLTIVGGGNIGDTIVSATATSIPPPTLLSVTGLAQLSLETYTNAIGYTPGNATNWAPPVPVDSQSAIDRLANAVAGLLGTPIP
jgi:hypothetical protein